MSNLNDSLSLNRFSSILLKNCVLISYIVLPILKKVSCFHKKDDLLEKGHALYYREVFTEHEIGEPH